MAGWKTRALLPMLLLLALAAGCSTPPPQGQQAAGSPKKVHVDAGLAQKVIDAAKTAPGVQDATAVAINLDILVGVKVTGFDRLRLKPVKTDVLNKVKAASPGYSVRVTADKKLFSELQAIAGTIQTGGYDPAAILQKIGKIKKDMTD
ncbi:MAG TPA: YhcN/YlaJ family sporulation lipoprotein [Spirochaetia bacterium]|nr:YhcN/YlaJ family sporulation lipoprotein [Spirochaetia bacterium]